MEMGKDESVAVLKKKILQKLNLAGTVHMYNTHTYYVRSGP